LWDLLRTRVVFQSALLGINAAVVGLLLAALYDPVFTSAIERPIDFGLALVAFAMLAFWKLPPWLVVILTAAGGAALALLRQAASTRPLLLVVDDLSRLGLVSDDVPPMVICDGDGETEAAKAWFISLLAACSDDEVARDMIIGHEIGHLRAGHLNWWMLTAPGRFMPFLGSAYSRACEYTADRFGAALCGDPEGARRGLTVLAAGGAHSRQVNLNAFVEQQQSLDTGWMTLARWLSTYPPLSARVAVIAPGLATPYRSFPTTQRRSAFQSAFRDPRL
jgi:hypothetical protein